MEPIDVIAVDGEAASGKSVCAMLAKKMGYELLDTGAIYRAATLIVLARGIDLNDEPALETVLACQMRFVGLNHHCDVTFRQRVITEDIRSSEISILVPRVAKHPRVRAIVTSVQHKFAEGKRVIAEGRDIGSVVFPRARVKFFLTADIEIRAKRRLNQYREKDPHSAVTLKEVIDQLKARDHEDKTRPHSPLVCVPGAITIDSTNMTKQETVDAMLAVCGVTESVLR